MLHQPVLVADDDPDVAQAIIDFSDTAAEIRERSAALLKLPVNSDARQRESDMVRELMSRIEERAARLGIPADQLMVLLNAALDERARRGRAQPSRPTPRTLLTQLTNAEVAVRAATAELRAAQRRAEAAAAELAAAEVAYKRWGSGRLVAAAR